VNSKWPKPIFSTLLALFATALPALAQFQVVETTIDDIHSAMKSGKLTSHRLVQDYLDRIKAYDKEGPALNCIITLNPNALQEADKLDAEYKKSGFVGPLHGIPVVVKDQADAAGMPTTLGSVLFKNHMPPDSFVVARLRKAGAVVLGKTTLGEFGAGDALGSELFGNSRNPYDLERTVGGSSGGNGGCLAANLSAVGVGEEGYASIRRPSTWNDLVGMRPTSGLVSRTGVFHGWPDTVQTLGPMARTVKDLALLLDSMVGYDPEDPLTALGIGHVPASYTQSLDKSGLKGARIGVIRESIGVGGKPDSDDYKKVDAEFQKNIAELKAAGAILVDPIVIPNLKEFIAKRADRTNVDLLPQWNWMRRDPNSPYKSAEDVEKSPDFAKLPPAKATEWKKATPRTPMSAYNEYIEARQRLLIMVTKLMTDNKLDAIVHKSIESQPPLIKDELNPPYVGNSGVPILNTYLGFAASMTVPAGFTSDNLPVGLTFFGLPYSEPTLLKLAYAYEQATHHRKPPKTAPELASSVSSGK